jgi:hypothetical protein
MDRPDGALANNQMHILADYAIADETISSSVDILPNGKPDVVNLA